MTELALADVDYTGLNGFDLVWAGLGGLDWAGHV